MSQKEPTLLLDTPSETFGGLVEEKVWPGLDPADESNEGPVGSLIAPVLEAPGVAQLRYALEDHLEKKEPHLLHMTDVVKKDLGLNFHLYCLTDRIMRVKFGFAVAVRHRIERLGPEREVIVNVDLQKGETKSVKVPLSLPSFEEDLVSLEFHTAEGARLYRCLQRFSIYEKGEGRCRYTIHPGPFMEFVRQPPDVLQDNKGTGMSVYKRP